MALTSTGTLGRAWPAEDRPGSAIAFHGARITLAVAVAVLTYMLFPASPAIDFPVYEVGSVASDNVIAPFAFRVLKSEAELKAEREAVVRGVEPVYDFTPAALDSARQSLTMFGNAIAEASRSTPATVMASIQRTGLSWGVSLSQAQAYYLSSERRRSAMIMALTRVFDRWLATGVANSGTLDSVRGVIVVRSRGEDRRFPAERVATVKLLVSRARLLH